MSARDAHAIISVGGYEIPLIGIPTEAALEECDCCGQVFPFQQLEIIGKQLLCVRCKEGEA